MPFRVISSTNSKKLALKIADNLGISFAEYEITKFFSGEYIVTIYQSLLDFEAIYIVSAIVTNDDIMELLSIIDACKNAGASDITLIAPYIAYGRQDKMEAPYSSVGFEILANILNISNITRLVTVDIHSYSRLSLFNFPVIHITSTDIIQYYSNHLQLEEYIIIAPDLGGKIRLGSMAGGYLRKERRDNMIYMRLEGRIEADKCLLVDDIIDSGKTMEAAILCLKNAGAKEVMVYSTHFLSNKNLMVELFVTDTIESSNDNSRILSIVPLICSALKNIIHT